MTQPQDESPTHALPLETELQTANNQQFATLGRYMVESRHGFNNAMMALLGNAELLLLDPAAFSPQVLSQLRTIREMAQRLNQVMVGFSLLEAELQKSVDTPSLAALSKVDGMETANASSAAGEEPAA
jgi:hypothetical protein